MPPIRKAKTGETSGQTQPQSFLTAPTQNEEALIIPNGANNDLNKWSPSVLVDFLKLNQARRFLDDEDIEIIRKNRNAGFDFLRMTKKDLFEPPYNLLDGVAKRIEQLIKALARRQGTFLPTTTDV